MSESHGYLFGPFRLYPSEGRLLQDGKRIRLYAKDFAVLVLLIENRGRLIEKSEFMAKVWRDSTVEEGNLTTNIAHIRKALGDNPQNPHYIETEPKRGYRFIAEVIPLPINDEPPSGRGTAGADDEAERRAEGQRHIESVEAAKPPPPEVLRAKTFSVESHKFVPVYLGEEAKELVVRGTEVVNQWAAYFELKYDGARFCIFPFGVGVWHLVEKMRFGSVTDLAIWRRRTYTTIIKSEEHPIISYTQDLLAASPRTHKGLLHEKLGIPGYVLSLFVLLEPLWHKDEELRNALRLLSCPNTLQAEDRADIAHGHAIQLEQRFLQEGFQSADIREYGLPGVNIGYASWSGLSYYRLQKGRSKLAPSIVEFELAVQALWWFCHCMKELRMSQGGKLPKILEEAAEVIPIQFSKLKTIGPTEPMQQRTMVEAVLTTSRLQELVEDVMALLDDRS